MEILYGISTTNLLDYYKNAEDHIGISRHEDGFLEEDFKNRETQNDDWILIRAYQLAERYKLDEIVIFQKNNGIKNLIIHPMYDKTNLNINYFGYCIKCTIDKKNKNLTLNYLTHGHLFKDWTFSISGFEFLNVGKYLKTLEIKKYKEYEKIFQ
ncbi:TPA: dephospho-CoA kinase [Bacillus cereus]|nr:dephospho-CoA kinase [Bacillus cereus]